MHTLSMQQSAPQKNIIILGGSYAGVSVAHYLLKHVIHHLPNHGLHRIFLISTSSQAMCRPACPRAMIDDSFFSQQKLFVTLTQVFEQYPEGTIRVVHGTATDLDHVNRSVIVRHTNSGHTEALDFHALVIATGASTPSPLHGLNGDSADLRKSWAAFRKVLLTAQTIVVAGAGPTGVETAGELGEYLNGRSGLLGSKAARTPKVRITLVSAKQDILPGLRPALAKKAEKYLARVGVEVIKDANVESPVPEVAGSEQTMSKNILRLTNGSTLQADLYIPATGSKPNTSFVHHSLLAADGRVDTNAATLRVDKAGPQVYAIGDVSSYARPAIHQILNAVPVLCANIKRDLLQASGEKAADGNNDRLFKEDLRETQLVPIGTSYGVGAAMGYQVPSFLVWLIKGRDYWLWTTGSLWSGKNWSKAS